MNRVTHCALNHLFRRGGFTLAIAALLAGCSLTPQYKRPAMPVATVWPTGVSSTDEAGTPAADLPWQDFVQDDQLRQLIELALENNRDLRIAVQNIEQARVQYQIRRADQFPTLGLSASGTRSKLNPYAALGGSSVNASYNLGVGVSSWELDFFGRVAALKEAALANYLATEEARRSAQISLIASVASTWLQLKTDTELLLLVERTLVSRRQSMDLTKLRFENGASSALDVRQAESLVATAQAARAQQERLRAQDINALALLVGQSLPPSLIPPLHKVAVSAAPTDLGYPSVDIAPTSDLPAFKQVPAGLPSDLLLRRPDIRAAEQQLIAANANIGAARANFFPNISLTGSFGRVSSDLDGLFGSDGTRVWSFGPSITLPIFDMGRNQANLDAAKAAREIAVAQYEKAVQTAFQEVADALAGLATLADQYVALQAQTEAERDRLRLADLRYRNGIASYLDILDAQRSLFAVEQSLAQARLAQRVNEVRFYKALGGGWTEPIKENDTTTTVPAEIQGK